MIKRTPYQILGLSGDFVYKDIKKAYRKATRENPPEKNPEKFIEISDAYDALTNENYYMQALSDTYHLLDVSQDNEEKIEIDSRHLKNIFEVPFIV